MSFAAFPNLFSASASACNYVLAFKEGRLRLSWRYSGSGRNFRPKPDIPIPHMGWNQIDTAVRTPLLRGIKDGSFVYFVHSFAAPVGGALWLRAFTAKPSRRSRRTK